MPDKQNVMPFQQDAGFFARRALKKQKDGRFQDAVVLLRRALEAAPDNAEYMLDLAETYSEMGCPVESNRCLLRLMTDYPERSVCWFALACNLFAMGNVQGAQSAALEYLEREPEGEYSARAADMIAAIQQAEQLHRPADRRLLRVYRLNERAASRLNGEQPAAAVRLLEKSLSLRDTPDTRALYAYALGETGRLDRAAREANSLLRRRFLPPEARVNALRALVAAGQNARALKAIDALDAKTLEPYEMRRVLDALLTMKSDRSMQEQLSRALRLSPFDRALLHAQAAAFFNEGRTEDALVWWRHMLEINPADSVASACVDAVSRGEPPARPIPMTLALAPELARRKRDAIASGQDSDALLAACRWALLEGDASACAAAGRLAGRGDRASETLLREALIEPTLSPAVKLAALDALKRRGAREPYFIVGRDTFSPGPENSRLTAPGRVIKECLAAACRLDDALVPTYLARWDAVMPRCLTLRRGALRGLSAALLARTAMKRGIAEDAVRNALNCSRRRLEYYTRKLNRLTGDETEA